MERKEKLNWWWFLLFAGIIIPGVCFGIFKMDPYYVYFHDYFIVGFHPGIIHGMNFLCLLIAVLLFKLLNRVRGFDLRIMYLLMAVFILFIAIRGTVMSTDTNPDIGMPRRYLDLTSWLEKRNNYYWTYVPGALIICLYIFFCIRNFPRKLGESPANPKA